MLAVVRVRCVTLSWSSVLLCHCAGGLLKSSRCRLAPLHPEPRDVVSCSKCLNDFDSPDKNVRYRTHGLSATDVVTFDPAKDGAGPSPCMAMALMQPKRP